MARRRRSDWDAVLDQYYNHEKFEVTVERLVNKARAQLHDSYGVQKMYDGTPGSSVWFGRKVRHYRRANDTTSGFVTITNWDEESRWRKANDKQRSSHGKTMERWYSTGHSADIADIRAESDRIENGVFVATTTFGMLMAELGLGKNGPHHVRGKGKKGLKGIKVQRQKNYQAGKRYVEDWVPGKGASHRPTTRRQLNFLGRAIRNYAADLFEYNLESWLIYDIAKTLNEMPLTFDSTGNMILEAKIPTKTGNTPISQVPPPQKL